MSSNSEGLVTTDAIRDEVELAFCTDLEFDGSFSFRQEYPSAPNPSLSADGVGTIGLPLSERDVVAIKSVAVQAPFGKGERTVVDKSVRDTWEIDGASVHIRNPNWSSFMSELVTLVCEALGMDHIDSVPKCELYKLLLYETGSHFLPHVDTEKVDGMFATIVVVLPSEFTGGDAHLSHGSLSAVYNSSDRSLYQTTALAWYTDIMHEIKPITSGYRLALSYNLIHTDQSLRPALSANDEFATAVRDALLSWNGAMKDGAPAPEKLLYLLEHKYSQANLRASALKGTDAYKVAALELVAKETGFHLGLATFEYRLSGTASDYGGGYEYSRNDDRVEFSEIEDREGTITSFVDLDGSLIANTIEYDEDHETIPAFLGEELVEGDYDGQEYEGYQGNYAGTLERWYRHTVLILWPDASDVAVRFKNDNIPLACKHLNNPGISETTKIKAIDFLLTEASKNVQVVAKAISSYAIERRDFKLWERCVGICGGKDGFLSFTPEKLVEAATTFGFDNIKPSLDTLFDGECSNRRRYETLKHILSWSEHKSRRDGGARHWVETKTSLFLCSLTKPANGEHSLFVELAAKHGGIDFFRDKIMPQILDKAEAPFLISLSTGLHTDDRLPESEVKSDVVTGLLIRAISQTSFTLTRPPQKRPYPWMYLDHGDSAPVLLINSTKKLLEACYALGRQELLGTILEKLVNCLANPPDREKREEGKQVAQFILEFVGSKLGPNTLPPPKLEELFVLAMKLTFIPSKTSHSLIYDRSTVRFFLLFSVRLLGNEFFSKSVLPKLPRIPATPEETSYIFLGLHDFRTDLSFPDASSLQGPMDSLIDCYIEKAPAGTTLDVHEVLDSLLHVKAYASIMKYFRDRIFSQGRSAASLLESLCPDIRSRIATCGDDVFGPLCQSILCHWIDVVVGAKPIMKYADIIAPLTQWTCSCKRCTQVKNFFKSGTSQTISLERIGVDARKHIEGQVSMYMRTAATSEVNRKCSPQGLIVTQTDLLWEHYRQATMRAQGRTMLQTLIPVDDDLKRLLGEHFDTIVTALQRTVKRPLPANQTQTVAGPSNSASTGPPTKKQRVDTGPTDVVDLTEV